MRILGIDPAIRNTGYAILEGDYRSAQTPEYGTLSLPSKLTQSECLLRIHEHLCELIVRHKPDELAIEGIIFVQSHRTAIAMGSARGAAVLAAARHGLRIIEYPPSCVKLATVGKGGALKQQVAFMMRALLHLRETPPPDAADALAIAYTHLAAADPARAHLFRDRRYI